VSHNKGSNNGGLSAGGKTAIAVVIPVVAVALLIVAGLFLWRKRNQRKSEKEERKKEMEEYGYNPNHDPTLPAVAATDEIVEDQSGYRGWGVTSSSNRQASTTVSGGMAHPSDGSYHSPGSPTQGASVSEVILSCTNVVRLWIQKSLAILLHLLQQLQLQTTPVSVVDHPTRPLHIRQEIILHTLVKFELLVRTVNKIITQTMHTINLVHTRILTAVGNNL